ncbi:MAG: isoleucyl-tRNA synthetase, partial [Cryptosporangiaceae bacterium]|nr:isoleucyl-tRNA synthetase [Cryptosporangiaceae bacterium]
AMDSVRDVASAALSLRKAKGLRVRLPLASLTVASPDAAALEPFAALLADEVNVKDVLLSSDVDGACSQVLALVPKVLGPRLGKDVQRVIGAVKSGDWQSSGGTVVAGGVELAEGEYTLRLVPADPDRSAPLPGDAGVVVLDTDVTPELAAEGIARDVVRAVQQARKDAGLDVSDRIVLTLVGSPAVTAAVDVHRDFVAAETLASVVQFADVSAEPVEVGDGEQVRVAVAKL